MLVAMARRGRPPHPDVLTPREWEVLALLREGLSNDEIAARLGITLAGAKYHVSEILGKLGVESREEAARWQPQAVRPLWAAIATPIGSAWRKLTSGPLPALTAASLALLIAAGIALLAWALLRTSGGGTSVIAPTSTAPAITQPAVVGAPTPTAPPVGTTGTACPGGPTAPTASAPLLAYAAPDNTIWVIGADGSNATQLICSATGGQNAAWSASGRYLAHVSEDGALHILDVETGKDTVADDGSNGTLLYDPSFVAYLQWSHVDDSLVYEKVSRTDVHVSLGLWRVTPGGTPSRVIDASGAVGGWSPDGRRILYTVASDRTPTAINSRTAQLFIVNADGSNAHKLTDGLLYALSPWSPDSQLIAYWKDDHGGSSTIGDIYVMNVDSGREVSLGEFTSDEHPQWSPDASRDVFQNMGIDPSSLAATPLFDRPSAIINWSPAGTKVAYIEGPAFGGQSTLVVFDTASGQKMTLHMTGVLVAHALGPGIGGVWSPDGRYYAYVSVDSTDGEGATALYVRDLQSGGENRIWNGTVNDLGTVSTAYSPDGSKLLVQEGFVQSPSVWMANADGSGLTKLTDGLTLQSGGKWAAWRP
jgi:Tol biopolymer transport system component/DNA-binding CsgD family transcriptional regulator